MKLITETSFDLTINESKSKGMHVVGIFSSAELKNNNGRIYAKALLEREVSKFRNKIDNKSAFGELGHPNQPEINPEKIAILIEKLEWRNNNLYGKAKVLDTPSGRIAQTLIKEGKMGISSRGLGTVNEDSYVNEDFQLLTYDLVSEPSNDPSWLDGIWEAKEYNLAEADNKKAEKAKNDNLVVTNEQITIPKAYFKWDANSESPEPVNEIKKTDFTWRQNETVRIDSEPEKIKVSDFKWGQSDSYGSIQESSPYTSTELHTNWNGYPKVIYVDASTKKIIHSVLPDFPNGLKIDETVLYALAKTGWQISYVNTRERNWRDQIK